MTPSEFLAIPISLLVTYVLAGLAYLSLPRGYRAPRTTRLLKNTVSPAMLVAYMLIIISAACAAAL